jgi:adenosylhomocysteinase
VNEASAERALNDRFGTGQSALDGIVRATHLLLAGRTIVVLGYGWTGRGVAARARGAGASVVVCEVDPLRALEARMEGFDVLPALTAAERGDVFITVTGSRDVLRAEHFAVMKDGAVLANAGTSTSRSRCRTWRRAHRGAAARRPLRPARRAPAQPAGPRPGGQPRRGAGPPCRGDGRLVRAPGAQRRAARAGAARARRAAVPPAIDAEVARLKLEALGVEIDAPTPAQEAYLNRWRR